MTPLTNAMALLSNFANIAYVHLHCWYGIVHRYFFPQFTVVCHSDSAHIPTKATRLSTGYDLYADETTTIAPWGRGVVATNVTIHMNDSRYYGRIAPRSGLAVKHGIHIGAGVVDTDYEGKIGVVVFNLSNEEFKIESGMRIAQLIFEQVAHPLLGATNNQTRGAQGFGSTDES